MPKFGVRPELGQTADFLARSSGDFRGLVADGRKLSSQGRPADAHCTHLTAVTDFRSFEMAAMPDRSIRRLELGR
jgi:hypothetical protein